MRERIVCIEWDDASFCSGYYDKKTPEDFEPILTRTVGHLIRRTPKSVLLSTDRFYRKGRIEGERHISIIPKKMIRRIVELKGDSQ